MVKIMIDSLHRNPAPKRLALGSDAYGAISPGPFGSFRLLQPDLPGDGRAPSDDPDRRHPAYKRAPEPVFDLTAIRAPSKAPGALAIGAIPSDE
jgi:hypothetical protein